MKFSISFIRRSAVIPLWILKVVFNLELKLSIPGKIVKEQNLAQWDATEWTLSNGVKVIVKPTKFKDDEILFSANALNGTASLPLSYLNSLKFMNDALDDYGLGTYSHSDLRKYLAGKQAVLAMSFGAYNRTFSGYATPKDLKYLMELIYMGFTDINFTAEEFEAMQKTQTDLLHNQENNPQTIFSKRLHESLYPNSPRVRPLTAENVLGANREEILKIAHDMTANAADYTFTFVGNLDMDALRNYVEQYIATLPANARKAQKKLGTYDPSFIAIGGKGIDTYTTKMETPQTWCYISTKGSLPYSMKNAQIASVAGQILSARLLESVREKEGAVYSISASGGLDRLSPDNAEIMTAFPMKPEKKEKVLEIISTEIANMANDVQQPELDKVKEYMVKNYKERKERNGAWLSGIAGWLMNGVDTFNGDEASMNAITVDDVKNFIKELNQQGNYRVVILDPAE